MVKKAHRFKLQGIIHYKAQQILSLCMRRGAVHDFEWFKINLDLILKVSFVLANKGDQGIYDIYARSLTKTKAKRGGKLDSELKKYNREINTRRIDGELVLVY